MRLDYNPRKEVGNMLEENYQVSKSKGLLALSELNLSLNELKILDIYLSRIDPRSIKDLENEIVEKLHNKNLTKKEVKEILDYRNDFIKKSATVTFTKEEYYRILEVPSNKIRKEQLNKYLQHLLSCSIILPTNEGYAIPVLFSQANFNKDDGIITLVSNVMSNEIKQLFFDVGNYQYIKYRLKNTARLSSIYSFKLYLYLLENKFRGTWKIDVEKLRLDILECTSKYYETYKWFNKDILKKVQLEINEKTNITFEYETIRKGRKVEEIQFTCHFKDTNEVINGEFKEKDLPAVSNNLTCDDIDNMEYASLEYVIAEIQYTFKSINKKEELSKAELNIIKELYELYGGRMMIVASREALTFEKYSLYYMRELMKTWVMKGYSAEDVENGKR